MLLPASIFERMNSSRCSCSYPAVMTLPGNGDRDTTTFAVADDHVARSTATPAADRHVDVLQVMDRRRHVGALPGGIGRQVERRDRRRVAKSAIGHDAAAPRSAMRVARMLPSVAARVSPRASITSTSPGPTDSTAMRCLLVRLSNSPGISRSSRTGI